MKSIADVRTEYTLAGLDEKDVDLNPIVQFDRWMNDALAAHVFEPTAVTLATATRDGTPSARIVLLKHYDDAGFCIFTNYHSAKGMELAENPKACLVAYWGPLERQVRICGSVMKTSPTESDAYFARRPRGSQLGAWVSEQSRPIADRDVLSTQLDAATARFNDQPVTRPPHWGGYRLAPSTIEFWQGRKNRLHDRLQYVKQGGEWKIERLAP
ncbi:MAG: pyridoxamine 5'-phosphate oxidase [Phycisphaeraceae bacterium]